MMLDPEPIPEALATYLNWLCYATGAAIVSASVTAVVVWAWWAALDYVLRATRITYGACAYVINRKQFRAWVKEHGHESIKHAVEISR